jgi:hypothetical protein
MGSPSYGTVLDMNSCDTLYRLLNGLAAARKILSTVNEAQGRTDLTLQMMQ